jgi:hydrogenase-4 component E
MMKNWIEVFSIVDFVSVGILLTAVALNGMRRLESSVKAYAVNSWLLSALIGIVAFMIGEFHLYAASLVTFISKGVVIPIFLRKIVREMKVTHEVEPYISNALSLTISGLLVAIVYASLKEGIFITGFSRNVLQISLAVILIGLFTMITRRKAITQVIGLLFMENGLFLAGFSLTYGMPMIIELGVLFDMLMGIIILGIFAVQIKRAFASSDLDKLTILKG